MRFIDVGGFGSDMRSRGIAVRRWAADLLDLWADRRFARSESRKALALYRSVRSERPELAGRELYREVLARCGEGLWEHASAYVRHAEESFAAWPAHRGVRFRDVVTYIIFDERVTAMKRPGTRADIEAVVASVIPAVF